MTTERGAPAITIAEAHARIDAIRARVPDNAIPLPGDYLPCESCGQATTPVERITKARFPHQNPRMPPSPFPVRELPPENLTRCSDCTALLAQAPEMIWCHPRLAWRLGSVVEDHAYSVLGALMVAGRDLPDPSKITEEDLSSMLRHIAPCRPRWIEHPAQPGTCAPYPWAHVSIREQAQITRATASVLADRLSRSQPDPIIEHPTGSGCLFCGVDGVRVPAEQVRRLGGPGPSAVAVWRPLSTTRAALGSSSHERIEGFTCPPCSVAVEEAAVGPTARERAVVAHVEKTRGHDAAARLKMLLSGAFVHDDPPTFPPSVPGWGSLPAASTNAAPWAHLHRLLTHY